MTRRASARALSGLLTRAGGCLAAPTPRVPCSEPVAEPSPPARALVALFDTPFVRAISERARLEILRVLIEAGPQDIERVAEQLPQDRSVISRHLKVLMDAGLVSGQRQGRRHVYRVEPMAFLATLEGLMGQVRALVPACCAPPSPSPPARPGDP